MTQLKSLSRRHLFIGLGCAAVVFSSTACEQESEQKVYAGRECLNSARTEADADRCISLVSGVEDSSAYLVRCSANFIAQGFTGTRFAQAFQKLRESGTTAQDPMATAMAFLVFSNSSARHSTETTVTNCTRANAKSLVRIATLAQLGTFVANPTGGALPANLNPNSGSFDPEAITTAINDLISGTASQQQNVGQLGIQAANVLCTEGSTFGGTEACRNLNRAISDGNGDSQAIGLALLNQLLVATQ